MPWAALLRAHCQAIQISDQITIADYNEERAREVAASLHSSNIVVKQIDVNDEERLRAILRGADVVLNAVEYVFNLPVLKACIQEKVHYADLGGLFHMTRRLMAMNDEVSAAGITCHFGYGWHSRCYQCACSCCC